MKQILLPCGKVALVSAEDWASVSKLSWYDRNKGYPAARWKKSAGGNGKLIMLHRFIMRPPAGYVVDHIDGDPLNNQRGILQITTQSRNLMRSPKKQGGVEHRNGIWYARIRVDGEIIRLGSFGSERDALEAVRAARESAWLPENNPLGTIFERGSPLVLAGRSA